jgi:hypothetical protein
MIEGGVVQNEAVTVGGHEDRRIDAVSGDVRGSAG